MFSIHCLKVILSVCLLLTVELVLMSRSDGILHSRDPYTKGGFSALLSKGLRVASPWEGSVEKD